MESFLKKGISMDCTPTVLMQEKWKHQLRRRKSTWCKKQNIGFSEACSALLIFLSIPSLGNAQTDPKYLDLTIERFHNGLQSGEFSCEDVVQAYLERINRLDRQGYPRQRINSMLALNPRVIEEAREKDASFRRNGHFNGSLHCVPFVVKDAFDVKGFPTTGGSRMLAGTMPKEDSAVVQRLKEAGALILGKTNMTELAAEVLSWNSWTHRIGNPYNPRRDVGGSSGGSGAAIAADFALMAIGEDTGGSVRIPSTNTMLVGLRPTTGLISRVGLLPLSISFDTPGPMGRSVKDVAQTLDVLAAQDPRDPLTMVPEYKRPSSYLDHLSRDGLRGKRIGVVRRFGLVGPVQFSTESRFNRGNTNDLTQRALDDMRANGAELVDVELPDFSLLPFAAILTEVSEAMDTYLSGLEDPHISRLIELNYLKADPRMAPILFGLAVVDQLSRVAPEPVVSRLNQQLLDWKKQVSDYVASEMDRLNLDVLVSPPVTQTAPRTNNALYFPLGMELAPITGGPSLVVPTGLSDKTGMPMSLEIHGRHYDEAAVLEVGFAYEQATHHRIRPDLP